MARQEKPLDPASGPLYLFARGLRQLRQQAGSPTYRQLEEKAGFRASTLSEAAKGAQLPSLDVTLAYVGACGGDEEAWEARWLAVRDELDAARRPAPELEPAAAEPAEPPPPTYSDDRDDQAAQPLPHHRSLRRPRTRAALAAAAAAVLVVVVVAFAAVANRSPQTRGESTSSGSAASSPPTDVASPATTPRASDRARPRPQAEPPFTAAVVVNPVNEIVAHHSDAGYVFSKPPTSLGPLPPDYRNPASFAAWANANGGGDADSTYIEITVQATGRTITLNSLDIYVQSKVQPPVGYEVRLDSADFAPKVEIRHGEVNLDDPAPTVRMSQGAEEFGYRLSGDEQIIIRIQATAERYDCVWYAKLRYTADGASGTADIKNGKEPFRTITSTGATVHIVQPDGSIRPRTAPGR